MVKVSGSVVVEWESAKFGRKGYRIRSGGIWTRIGARPILTYGILLSTDP